MKHVTGSGIRSKIPWFGSNTQVKVGRITKLLYDRPSISAFTKHVMKTIIPKSGLDEIRNKVALPLTLRCIWNSTNYKSHYIPFGLPFPPQVPLPKSPKPSRVRFPTRTGTHLSPPMFRMVVSHLASLPSKTEVRRAQGKTVA